MKRYGLFGALIGFVVAVFVFIQVPATAQQSPLEASWEIYTTASNEHLLVVKHNRVTGQTLILTCGNNCGAKEEWHEYQVD